ncbi:hypothetical protein GLOTRDRAFT_100730 [Gloeophyllum trabeum ATCC 11539]|uniref:Uncharacterized protein n=1 Tax=Gloeophyllum trabeum (strain ATCC 11539 / FP-39264 / Madison 617) TaxID=670483 RepID=S7RM15_GLOTA|nr:uncharacterized protein GLOTRDRAFT_100730 [Gloeophyllum trabeum ATCC 11539]EPQ53754.1 hypothetical protein GLOTRDRAFT_100730 [Gloeophyllum trabeum ATCC 11539]
MNLRHKQSHFEPPASPGAASDRNIGPIILQPIQPQEPLGNASLYFTRPDTPCTHDRTMHHPTRPNSVSL